MTEKDEIRFWVAHNAKKSIEIENLKTKIKKLETELEQFVGVSKEYADLFVQVQEVQ